MPRSRKPLILVVDDEEAMREVLRERLSGWGYNVRAIEDGESAVSAFDAFDPAVVLSDVMLPDLSGIELLAKLQERSPQPPVVLITAHGTVDLAVEAMKQGAQDFLTKPLDYDQLKSVLEAVLQQADERRKAEALTADVEDESASFAGLVGATEGMHRVFELIREVADSEASVLITGETGTGKELVARAMHDLSRRREGPFVAVNAAAVPRELMESEIFGHEKGAFTGASALRRGCFELAHEGTLLLDEIGEMPLALQPKLLRVLEDGRVRRLGGDAEIAFNVRVLAATNTAPPDAIRDGDLREDLYYRLNIFEIELPPLRERLDDLPLLAQHFLSGFNQKHDTAVKGLRDGALESLAAYHWPGNVRELRNVVERAVVLASDGWIEASHLPPYLAQGDRDSAVLAVPVGTTVAEAERRLILKTLERTDNNKAEAARQLGIDVKTVRNKLKAWEEQESEEGAG